MASKVQGGSMDNEAFDLTRAVRKGDQEWLEDWLQSSLWDGRGLIWWSDDGTAVYQASLLHKVLKECDHEALPSILRLVLRHGADPNLRIYPTQDAPLHIAVTRPADAEILVAMLIHAGADLTKRNAKGDTAWHVWLLNLARNFSVTPSMEQLVRRFALALPVQHGNNERWTPLHFASLLSSTTIPMHLIQEYQAPVHATTVHGQTPLHLACRFGCSSVMELLLHNGAFAYASDAHGRTPFHEAALSGSLNKLATMIQFAIQKYGLVNWSVRCRSGTTLLHNSVLDKRTLDLVKQSSVLQDCDAQGWTALHYAAWVGNVSSATALSIPELLVAQDHKGHTVLHVAAFGLPIANHIIARDGRASLSSLRDQWWNNMSFEGNETAELRRQQTIEVLLENQREYAYANENIQLERVENSRYVWSCREMLAYLLNQPCVRVGIPDLDGNYPWAYTDDIDAIYMLVKGGVREGLFG
jgi:ankyrin repeat protein